MKMDNMQIGYFIAECRKEKQITQQELADKLNITNKAVSKWETGKGLSDVTLLAALADMLEVSVDEILKAKKKGNDSIISENRINNKTGENVINHNNDAVISYLLHKSITKFKLMAMVSILLSFAGVIIQYFVWVDTKNLTGWLFGCWFEICSAGIFYYFKIMMDNQVRDYNNTAEKTVKAKDISNPYFKLLITAWVVMLMTILLYII